LEHDMQKEGKSSCLWARQQYKASRLPYKFTKNTYDTYTFCIQIYI